MLLLLGQLGEMTSDLNEGTITFIFERGKKEDDRNTDQSAAIKITKQILLEDMSKYMKDRR